MLLARRQNVDSRCHAGWGRANFCKLISSVRSLCLWSATMAQVPPAMFNQRMAMCRPKISFQSIKRAYSHFPPARRRYLLQGSRVHPTCTNQRALTTASVQKFADVDSSFDPRQQDRESDEVDVCIVGGGTSIKTYTCRKS